MGLEGDPGSVITKVRRAGEGTYGIVYTAQRFAGLKERPTPGNVAVKRNLVDNTTDFIGSLKELDVLSRLNGHPYIVKLIDVSFGDPFKPTGGMMSPLKSRDLKDDAVHFLFEHATCDAHHLLHEATINIANLKIGMIHLLLAVEYIHAHNIIHRDIKPTNILIFDGPSKQQIFKLCDFGMSKFRTNQGRQSPGTMTSWYRGPEVCVDWPDYSYKADMWSVGCVLFEFMSRRPLLYDVRDRNNTIFNAILGVLPEPAPTATLNKLFKYRKVPITAAATPLRRKSWADRIAQDQFSRDRVARFNNEGPGTYPEFLDLLNNLLQLDPDQRWSATQALASPFCQHYADLINQTRAEFAPQPFPDPILIVCDAVERKWATVIAFTIFNNRSALAWYRHRILFQAIDMFDRYFDYVVKTSSDRVERVEDPEKERGRYLSRYEVELRFTVCLYVSIKYFTTLNIPISYAELTTEEYRRPDAKRMAEEFEKHLIKDVLQYRIYRDTVYEIADAYGDILDEKSIRDLLMVYGSLTCFTGLTACDLYRLYRVAMIN